MDKANRKALDEFGELFVREVRDEAFADIELIVSGEGADAASKELHKRFAQLNAEDAAFIQNLLATAVDAGIARFLYFLDQFDIEVVFQATDGKKHDVRAISDGLHGELWTEDGWFARFSRFRDKIDLAP